jgi:bifunctional UDP-N-acetylglucosamine pyrophosphorylase/glucosamine-1-phosphate N-acetyltransferase
MKNTAAIILAAGKGTRMKSKTPKVLLNVCGIPILEWVLRGLAKAGVNESCLIISDDTGPFKNILTANSGLSVAIQKNRQGTGDAAASAAWSFAGVQIPSYAAGGHQHGRVLNNEYVLICAGDVPAPEPEEYQKFLQFCFDKNAEVAVLGMDVPNPKGYGRLVTEGESLLKIVEEKDADEKTKKITACNTGILFFKTKVLFQLLCELTTDNAQKEYYLTDCVEKARNNGLTCWTLVSKNHQVFQGVNDREQLSSIECLINSRMIRSHMASGVSFHLPETTLLEADVKIGSDTFVSPGLTAKGKTQIGADCTIGPNVTLVDVVLEDGVEVGAQSYVVNTTIKRGEKIYPGSVIGLI